MIYYVTADQADEPRMQAEGPKIRHWGAKNKREIDTESIYAIHTWNNLVDTTDLSVSVLFYRKISSNPK